MGYLDSDLASDTAVSLGVRPLSYLCRRVKSTTLTEMGCASYESIYS